MYLTSCHMNTREFLRNFRKVKSKTLRIEGKNGELIGTWIPGASDEKPLKPAPVSDKIPEKAEKASDKCGKCGGQGVVALWTGWNELTGEVLVDLPLCAKCAKGRKDVKWI